MNVVAGRKRVWSLVGRPAENQSIDRDQPLHPAALVHFPGDNNKSQRHHHPRRSRLGALSVLFLLRALMSTSTSMLLQFLILGPSAVECTAATSSSTTTTPTTAVFSRGQRRQRKQRQQPATSATITTTEGASQRHRRTPKRK